MAPTPATTTLADRLGYVFMATALVSGAWAYVASNGLPTPTFAAGLAGGGALFVVFGVLVAVKGLATSRFAANMPYTGAGQCIVAALAFLSHRLGFDPASTGFGLAMGAVMGVVALLAVDVATSKASDAP